MFSQLIPRYFSCISLASNNFSADDMQTRRTYDVKTTCSMVIPSQHVVCRHRDIAYSQSLSLDSLRLSSLLFLSHFFYFLNYIIKEINLKQI